MLYTSRESVEDRIIRLLSLGEKNASDLYHEICLEGADISIQALYKALRSLIKESVVVKSGRILAISQEWAATLNEAISNSFSLPVLSEGESIIYHYRSLANLDAYWKHLINFLQYKHPNYPVFLYSPYEIWSRLEGRKNSQLEFFKKFEKEMRFGFLVIGNNSPFDAALKTSLQSPHLQIDVWEKPLLETGYITIIGDYVITTKIGARLVKNIIAFYNNPNLLAGDKTEATLNSVLKGIEKAVVKLERNPGKAALLRKKLSKNFYLPPQLKEQYHLFD